MEENRMKLLSEVGAWVVHDGFLNKPPPSTNLDASTFKKRKVKLLCVTKEGFKKLFKSSKKQSNKYFGSGKNAIVYCLCYWKNDEISPIRVISLEGCFIGKETNTEIKIPDCFILVTLKRRFYFQASSEKERKDWVEIINKSLQICQDADKSNYYEEAQKYPEESNCVFLSLKSNSNSYENVSVSKPCEQLCKKQSNEHDYEEIPPPKPQSRILTAEHKKPESEYDVPELDESISNNVCRPVQEENISAGQKEGYIQMKNEEATGDEYSYPYGKQIYNDDSDMLRTYSERIVKTPVPTPRARIKTDSELELRKDREVKTKNCKMTFGDTDIEFNVDHCEANVNGKQVAFSTSIVGFVKKDNILKFPHLRITCKESSGISIKSCSSQEVILNHEKDHTIKITMTPVPTYV